MQPHSSPFASLSINPLKKTLKDAIVVVKGSKSSPSLYPAEWLAVWESRQVDGSNLMTATKKGHSPLKSLHPPKKVTLDREQDRQWQLLKCTQATPGMVTLR